MIKQAVLLVLPALLACSATTPTYTTTETSQAVAVVHLEDRISTNEASYLLRDLNSWFRNRCSIDTVDAQLREYKLYIPITCTSSGISRYDIRRAVRDVLDTQASRIEIRTY